MTCVLDHIVFTAASLELGDLEFQQKTGLRLAEGGKHPGMGTHNRLLSLGPDRFLALICKDPDAEPLTGPMWFGLNDIEGDIGLSPHALVLRSDDLEGDLEKARDFGVDLGAPLTGYTQHLSRFRQAFRALRPPQP